MTSLQLLIAALTLLALAVVIAFSIYLQEPRPRLRAVLKPFKPGIGAGIAMAVAGIAILIVFYFWPSYTMLYLAAAWTVVAVLMFIADDASNPPKR